MNGKRYLPDSGEWFSIEMRGSSDLTREMVDDVQVCPDVVCIELGQILHSLEFALRHMGSATKYHMDFETACRIYSVRQIYGQFDPVPRSSCDNALPVVLYITTESTKIRRCHAKSTR
jgi:hypothetical protein